MTRILLVDDHELVRSGLRSILQQADDIEVVGEAASGEEAVDFVVRHAPDLVLMDVNMPGIGGIEATRKIIRRSPAVRVIAVTVLDAAPFPSQLLDAGARGYLSKGCGADEMFGAVRAVMRGEHYISADVAQRLTLSKFARGAGDTPLAKLSPREMQVLMMITQGKNNQDISESLFLSPKTISTYRHRLYEKLQLHNDVELTHFAIRHGLIDQPQAQ